MPALQPGSWVLSAAALPCAGTTRLVPAPLPPGRYRRLAACLLACLLAGWGLHPHNVCRAHQGPLERPRHRRGWYVQRPGACQALVSQRPALLCLRNPRPGSECWCGASQSAHAAGRGRATRPPCRPGPRPLPLPISQVAIYEIRPGGKQSTCIGRKRSPRQHRSTRRRPGLAPSLSLSNSLARSQLLYSVSHDSRSFQHGGGCVAACDRPSCRQAASAA